MASPIFGWFTGNTQGAIEGFGSWAGEDDVEGREGSSIIYQLDHSITIPRNPGTGLPSGQRVHHPLRVIKRIDSATPKLFQALCSGEHFSEVVFKWYRVDAEGGGYQQHFFTTTLEDAILVEMKDWFPITVDASKDQYPQCEDLAFTYRKIRWTWEVDGIEAQDDWKKQDAA